MEHIIIQISKILIIAVGFATIMKILRQPLIIGYIFTGILVGPSFLNLLSESITLGTFSKIGVALLLFTVGIHLNPRVIKEVGKISLITGLGQVIFTSVIGFLISRALGLDILPSVYISIALTFSSTIIIMKLITDKGDTDSVYGKISIGFLIVQDLIAVFILMAVSSMSIPNLENSIIKTLIYGTLSVVALIVLGWKLLPTILKQIAKSQEFLFLFSISWCLAIASWFAYLNFSLEIGALLAGILLSSTPYSNEISSKLKPLRDFFIVLFFIVIGSQMTIGNMPNNWIQIIIFSIFILIGNPFIVMVLMGIKGYTKKTGFLAGLTVAQISEFSIILVSLGVSVGHLTTETLSLVTIVGLITIAGSTYMITYSNWIYSKISKYLKIFEKKNIKEKRKKINKECKAILFGYDRIGFGILNSLKKIKRKYLVVDFNPETISSLEKLDIPALYGDVDDYELLEELPLNNIEIAISTIPDFETNELLIKAIRKENPKAIIIVRANRIKDAFELYEKGASYVLTPHFLGGSFISKLIKGKKNHKEAYECEKRKHIEMLKKIQEKGIKHPEIERN